MSSDLPDGLRAFLDRLLRFDTTDGNEAEAQAWFAEELDRMGFEVYEWEADPEEFAAHPSFPDDPGAIDVEGRPSVGGVFDLGSGGETLVLNGHVDVVPADLDSWSSDPFDPVWEGDRLTARGAVDMKSGLAACVFAALALAEREGLSGRVVVESVAGEEEGGIGAAAAALSNPYPFERDAAIVAEPTGLEPVIATEGSLMKRLRIKGRSAHAATTWRGESVLPHFERIRQAFSDLETERGDRLSHPLYEGFPIPLPVNCGTVRAGSWASSVPAALEAEFRIGVAPDETVSEVEAEFEQRLADVAAESEWLTDHPPSFERFSIQFEPSEIDPEEGIVRVVSDALAAYGREGGPRGATYGADSRHYVEAGIPTVLFGPGNIDQAHFPDETMSVSELEEGTTLLADAAARYLSEA
ncbi:ArgE/DapE family deacylase [Natronorarus salvus]|uniref:ArgE/DapE family deacylase n=1 Tax=Natronorarus salvus TaxID=3117733 RepID=UPI002F26705B